MSDKNTDIDRRTYKVREVVGTFESPASLQSAVDQLEVSGVDRAAISILASDGKVVEKLGHKFRSVADIMDDGRAPQTGIVSSDSVAESETLAIGIPAQIGAMGGAVAVVASGGALAAAIAATVAGGVVGAALGAILVKSVMNNHRHHVEGQLSRGGLVLWVRTPDQKSEQRATDILKAAGASNVHAHEIERSWGMKDVPLNATEPDPLLW